MPPIPVNSLHAGDATSDRRRAARCAGRAEIQPGEREGGIASRASGLAISRSRPDRSGPRPSRAVTGLRCQPSFPVETIAHPDEPDPCMCRCGTTPEVTGSVRRTANGPRWRRSSRSRSACPASLPRRCNCRGNVARSYGVRRAGGGVSVESRAASALDSQRGILQARREGVPLLRSLGERRRDVVPTTSPAANGPGDVRRRCTWSRSRRIVGRVHAAEGVAVLVRARRPRGC